jgi:hypothetical protein
MHNSCNTNLHFYDSYIGIMTRIQIFCIYWWHDISPLIRCRKYSTMLNRQMFGTKMLATQHPTSWNKPPKVEWQKFHNYQINPWPPKKFVSKTFVVSRTYSCFFLKLNSADGLSIWLHMQMIWIFKEIQNENEFKMNFLVQS